MSINSSQVSRTPGRGVKIGKGRGPVAAAILAVAAAGTIFAVNVVNDEGPAVGLVLEDHTLAVREADSVFASGSTVNTLYLPTPFAADAASLGYTTGTSSTLIVQVEVVSNPTGANFECVIGVAANAGTGGGLALFPNLSGTGITMKAMSGHLLGPTKGMACNTRDRIKSTTALKAAIVSLRSSVTN